MALKTVVKVGGISNLSDARYCAGMGVDYLGFTVIDGQPNSISAKAFQEIRGWVTGPQIVAEIYGIKSQDQLPSILESFQPDYYELALSELEMVGNFLTLPYILRVKPGDDVPNLENKPAFILVNSDTQDLTKLIPECEVLMGVSDLDGLNTALHKTGITGVSLIGGQEIKPGLRNYETLADVLEALEED